MSASTVKSFPLSILLADDDAQLATFLSKSLESAGYSVHTALDEESVVEELKRQNYQLIILDLNFGRTDGLSLLERLRTEGLETPVIVLSARNHVTDRIESLNLGADDYVTKPFSFQELAARANALLRRKTDPSLSILRLEDLELDPATRKAHRREREIRLSPKEFDLLSLLLRRAGTTVTRQELLRECWGHELEGDSNLVDVYVNYLRKKVDFPEDEKLIQTIRGEGYRLGKPASQKNAGEGQSGSVRSLSVESFPAPPAELPGPAASDPGLRSSVHSVAHDLAQPLTSVRCFLEVLALEKGLPATLASDLNLIEQQADRAIALTKGMSALLRELLPAAEAWVPLDHLVNDIFDDFSALVNSGMLTVERTWDPSVEVSSSPVLRRLLLLILCKLVGRNTEPLSLAISADVNDDLYQIRFTWKAAEPGSAPAADGHTILAKDMKTLEQMAGSLNGTISIIGEREVLVVLPVTESDA